MRKKLAVSIFVCIFSLTLLKISSPATECPQARKTRTAPEEFLKLQNPFPLSPENIAEGRELFLKNAKPAPCYRCHGEKGDGEGKMGKYLRPSPRNFTCQETMSQIPDGQMYWIIRNGSKATGMAAFPEKLLPEDDLWKIIVYIRSLAR